MAVPLRRSAMSANMRMLQSIYAGDVLFVSSLLASKLAVALLLFRLSGPRHIILAAYALMGCVGLWGFASIMAVAIRPRAATPWVLDTPNATHVVRRNFLDMRLSI